MKKITLISGVVSSIITFIGVLFKIMHWPGAGVAITVGITLFAIYALLLFIDKQEFATTSMQKVSNVFVLVAMVLVAGGFLFKMQHWPGAGVLIYISNVALFVLIPFSFLKASKETDAVKRLNFYNEAFVLVLLFSFSMLLLFR
jgi:hypothetical protein